MASGGWSIITLIYSLKVASGGWEMASGGWVKHKVPVLNAKCHYYTIQTLSFLLSDLYDKFLYTF